MPEPRLRCLLSRGVASPKNRLKNSSSGSPELLRKARCELVEILTTIGVVRFAIAANDGGRFSSGARFAAVAGGVPVKFCAELASSNQSNIGPPIATSKYLLCDILYSLLLGPGPDRT